VSDKDWRAGNPVYDDIRAETVKDDPSFDFEEDRHGSWDVTFLVKATRVVTDYIEDHFDKSDGAPQYFEVYVVWFAKTLGNWKALISSTLPDGKYYEVTYNGEKKETYLDAYVKVQNVCIPD
jgi:hypothetical protein